MRTTILRTGLAVLIVAVLVPGLAVAQAVPPDVWRDVATRAGAGSDVRVRLADGTTFRATLVRVDDTGVMLQPKGRVPVPVQAVPYASIASIELQRKGGVGAGKAAAIGVAVGAAAFWGMVGIALAIWSD
jgi:hypothetical protein